MCHSCNQLGGAVATHVHVCILISTCMCEHVQDYALIQGKGDACTCKPAQHVVTSLQTDYTVDYKT